MSVNTKGWEYYDKGSVTLDLRHPSRCHVDVRCKDGAAMWAVTEDGELLYLDQGPVLEFKGLVQGFVGLVVEAAGSFALRSEIARSDSVVDPVPAQVSVTTAVDPVQAAVQEAIREQLWRLQERGMLEDEQVEELLREIQEDELEFEDDEPDPFGLGHMEPPEARPVVPEVLPPERPISPLDADDAPPEPPKKGLKPKKARREAEDDDGETADPA